MDDFLLFQALDDLGGFEGPDLPVLALEVLGGDYEWRHAFDLNHGFINFTRTVLGFLGENIGHNAKKISFHHSRCLDERGDAPGCFGPMDV